MEKEKKNSIQNFKVILLGETGAGKSSLIETICSKENINCMYDCNVEFGSREIPILDQPVSIQFFNMIDSQKTNIFRQKNITTPFFKDSSLIIIVFDLSQPSYIETISRWMFEVEKHSKLFHNQFKILCLGTKADKKPNHYFLMNSEPLGAEIALLSKKFSQNILYYEVTSKDCNSCNKLLNQIKLLAESHLKNQTFIDRPIVSNNNKIIAGK